MAERGRYDLSCEVTPANTAVIENSNCCAKLMPSIKGRQTDRDVTLLVAAAESGQLEHLQQLLPDLNPNCQTVVCILLKDLLTYNHHL